MNMYAHSSTRTAQILARHENNQELDPVIYDGHEVVKKGEYTHTVHFNYFNTETGLAHTKSFDGKKWKE